MTPLERRELTTRLSALWDLSEWVRRVRLALWAADLAIMVAFIASLRDRVHVPYLLAAVSCAIALLLAQLVFQALAARRLRDVELWVREHHAETVQVDWPPTS